MKLTNCQEKSPTLFTVIISRFCFVTYQTSVTILTGNSALCAG